MGDPRQMWDNMQKALQRAQKQGPRYAEANAGSYEMMDVDGFVTGSAALEEDLVVTPKPHSVAWVC